MGSPSAAPKPVSQSRRASSGWPALKAAVAWRARSSAAGRFMARTLEQTNAAARKLGAGIKGTGAILLRMRSSADERPAETRSLSHGVETSEARLEGWGERVRSIVRP